VRKISLGVCHHGSEMKASSGHPQFAIVEDDPFMAQLVSDMLITGGIEVQVFMFGLDLLKCANLLSFKTIVLDLSLPDVDGFDLMDKLAADNIGMSIVLMSGHDIAILRGASIYANGIGLNVRGALTKPFTRGDLFAALGLA
jgi:FixJ family two-component response regulator